MYTTAAESTRNNKEATLRVAKLVSEKLVSGDVNLWI